MNKKLMTAAATILLATTLTAQAGGTGRGVDTTLATRPGAFVSQGSVKMRLESLMGLVNARFLQKNFGTVSTLQNSGGVVAVTGCRPHACASNGSLVLYDRQHDAFNVWLTVNDKTRVFQDKAFVMPANLNSDVRASIENMP